LALVTECKVADAMQGRSTQSSVMPTVIAAETFEKCFPHSSPYSWPHIRQLILQWYLLSFQPSLQNSLLFAASLHSMGTRKTSFHMCVFVQTVSSLYTAGSTRAAGYCCNAWSHGALAHDLSHRSSAGIVALFSLTPNSLANHVVSLPASQSNSPLVAADWC